jgi:hypothetical protein
MAVALSQREKSSECVRLTQQLQDANTRNQQLEVDKQECQTKMRVFERMYEQEKDYADANQMRVVCLERHIALVGDSGATSQGRLDVCVDSSCGAAFATFCRSLCSEPLRGLRRVRIRLWCDVLSLRHQSNRSSEPAIQFANSGLLHDVQLLGRAKPKRIHFLYSDLDTSIWRAEIPFLYAALMP